MKIPNKTRAFALKMNNKTKKTSTNPGWIIRGISSTVPDISDTILGISGKKIQPQIYEIWAMEHLYILLKFRLKQCNFPSIC